MLEGFENYAPWMYLAAGASLTLFFWSLFSIYQDIASRIQQAQVGRSREFSSPIFKILVTFARPLAQLLEPYSRKAEVWFNETGQDSVLLAYRRNLVLDLRRAGNPENMNADEFIGLIILSTMLGLLSGGFVYAMYPYTTFIWAFGFMGIFLPKIWLSDLIRQRRKSIRKALPYALDLLTLAVEAGLDFTNALARIADRLGDSALGSEFRMLLQEIQMGKIRGDALKDMAERVSLYDLTSVVSSLTQSDELGAPLGPVLRIQSEFIRTRRAQEAEEMAMKAPVKLLAPLILCIFPTAFVMLFGPLALKYMFKL